MVEERKVYNLSVGRNEEKREIGRHRRRRDGIRMDLREMDWKGVDWMQLAQNMSWWQALVNTVENLRVLAPHS
jgi:hypothetical protein